MLAMHCESVKGHRKCQNLHKARRKEMKREKMDPGRTRLGQKIDRLVVYTSRATSPPKPPQDVLSNDYLPVLELLHSMLLHSCKIVVHSVVALPCIFNLYTF